MLSAVSSLKTIITKPNICTNIRQLHITATCEAARKGTREKARKKKVKVEVKKVGFIPHNLRDKNKLDLSKINKHVDDSWKAVSKDNVYVGRYYRWTVYTVEQAIQCHRETHHPTMYNVPNAPVNVHIEINMQGEKATRFVDNFHRMAMIPHKFDHGENRQILAFTKNNEHISEAREAGATLVGGVELIKDIQNGDLLLSDYQHIIAHTNILPDLVVLRGLMKKKFPNPKNGTLGPNLTEMINKFVNGVSYSAVKDENQQNFGLVTACIGTLDMDAKHLEENLVSLLKDIDTIRPKRDGKFITRVLIKSPPSPEQLKIDPFVYISEEYVRKSGGRHAQVEEDEEADDENIKSAVN